MKRTKIIATVWPATNSKKKLIQLYKAWVNIIRFNFSHANYEESWRIADIIKQLNKENETNLSLLLDTKWPEIRTWDLEEKILFRQWDIFKIYTDETLVDSWNLFCDYKYLSEDIDTNGVIVIDSGLLSVKVLSKFDGYVEVEALNSAEIGSRRHINLPWVTLRMPWVTSKDKKDIKWWIENDFSFIAASFIRNASNVEEVKTLLKENNAEHIKIISKVENQESIDNLDEIIASSDWIMVARGDLWIEVPIEKLAVYQKEMVDKCKTNGKFVIVATHLLETMIDNPFPTRAESSDVFNAVMQKPDCLMLSGETAIWAFPIETVKMMTSLIQEAEKNVEYLHESYVNKNLCQRDLEKKLLIKSWIFIWEELEAKALIILTKTGKLARLAASFRPKITTYAFTPFESTVSLCNAYFGIDAFYLKKWNPDNYNKTLEKAIKKLVKKNVLKKDDQIIAINDIQKDGNEIPVMEIIVVDDFI